MSLRRPVIPWLGRLSALALLSLVASGARAAGPALVDPIRALSQEAGGH